jgi:hypothetical protein
MKFFLVVLIILLSFPNLINKDINYSASTFPVYNNREAFNPELMRLNSLDKLEHYTDSIAAIMHITGREPAYAILLESIIKTRFFHGYSHQLLSKNWIAAVSEAVMGYALSCTVYSNDILLYTYAACSQQAMVMMDILKRKNIPCRHVTFQHHFAVEAMLNNKWYYFDPNLEPAMPLQCRSHHLWAANADHLKQFYQGQFSNATLDYVFGNAKPAHWGRVNAPTAPNAKIFHSVTQVLSHWAWLLPLALLFVKKKRRLA